eukprot:scaffold85916_cov30-Tisochrysis_lutea.AAC.3
MIPSHGGAPTLYTTYSEKSSTCGVKCASCAHWLRMAVMTEAPRPHADCPSKEGGDEQDAHSYSRLLGGEHPGTRSHGIEQITPM